MVRHFTPVETNLRCSAQAPATTSPELVFSRKSTAASETQPYPPNGRAGSPSRPSLCASRNAFTLVELLIVISIIGIIAAMVISSYSNAAQDTRNVVALQQQAELQGALNNWITGVRDINGRQLNLSEVKALYDAAGSNAARIALIDDYLDDTTVAQFQDNSNAWVVNADGELVSGVMDKVGQSVYFTDWVDGSYPKVILNK